MVMFQNRGIGSCVKCYKKFQENDIIATSTTQHYCYECASKINLVTGKIKKDLCIDQFVKQISFEIKSISKKLNLPNKICQFSQDLISHAFENSFYVSKNKLGLACAAISLANKIQSKNYSVDSLLPISHKVLAKNLYLLHKSLEDINIPIEFRRVQEIKN